MSLAIDGMTDEEVRALDAYAQACALSDLIGELKRLKDAKNAALSARRNARIEAIGKAVPFARDVAVIEAQATLDLLANEIALRKEQRSILQTLLRAVPT